MKICTKYLIEKLLEDFNKSKSFKNGIQSWCKLCMKEYKKKYRKINKSLISSYNKVYSNSNKEQKRIYMRTYRNFRYYNDIQYRIGRSLRRRLHRFIKGKEKLASSINNIDCSILELKQYLESKFQSGMTWKNHNRQGWHIDHIKPLSKFDLTKKEELLEAVNYTNLQPLWAKENIMKGNKWV